MKISLIQPYLSTSERYGELLGKVGPSCEPLGLAYLAAAIREKCKEDSLEIIDALALGYTDEDLREHLLRTKPDVVGVSMLTPMYLRARETISLIKKTLPETIIVVGGPHPTIFPKKTLEENPDIDFIIIGEGEHTIVELLDTMGKKEEFP